MKPLMIITVMALSSFHVSGSAQGALITYTFSGTGSGSINDTVFTNALFQIAVHADTDAITHPSFDVFTVNALSSSIVISGIGAGDFTITTRVFDGNFGALGFSKASGLDLLDLENNPAWQSYQLNTAIGPIFSPTVSAVGQFVNIPTTLGNLSFNQISNVTFQATIPGEATVPEPTSVIVWLGLAIGMIIRRQSYQITTPPCTAAA